MSWINVTPKQVRAFVAVAECGGFAEACARLHLSQPALSTAVRKLELLVGGRLFDRTTRSLALTPEGESFLPVARRLLADWEQALADLQRLFAKERGRLAVAAMPSFAATRLPRLLARFLAAHPNLDIQVEDVVAEQVVERVRSGRAELGFTFRPQDPGELVFVPLYSDRFVAALPARHPLAAKAEVRWRELAAHPMLLLQRPSALRSLVEETLASLGLAATVALEAHQLATLGRMVAEGLGVSVVPTLYRESLEGLGAVCRALREPVLEREVGVLHRRKAPLSAAARALLEHLQEEGDAQGGP
ncbi:MAG: LysR family transcriptional regulator [Porticoccaceae bacterium]|nr:MAG: LysR family transcriptional regulator [Porticoccaceae bacterium]